MLILGHFRPKKVVFTCPHDNLDYMWMLLMLCWRCMVAWEQTLEGAKSDSHQRTLNTILALNTIRKTLSIVPTIQ